ncbi:MAG: hypothetical protein Q4D06_08010 [Coriobacteriia bacterium]|nr:hypothetical protein [Coriobacteriia bacterium]
MTIEEFVDTLLSGWEIDFVIEGVCFHYQRSWIGDAFQLYLTTEQETLYESVTLDMDAATAEIMSLPIFDDKSIEELSRRITVVSSS